MRNFIAFIFICALPAFAYASDLKDPTQPGGYAATSSAQKSTASALRLTMVRLGAEPLAIINGNSVRVGDRVGDQRVAAIQPGRVVLNGTEGARTLLLSAPLQSVSNSNSYKSIKRRSSL